jgi:hypothetical protein
MRLKIKDFSVSPLNGMTIRWLSGAEATFFGTDCWILTTKVTKDILTVQKAE